MAMTKKEKAEFDAAIAEAWTLAALRWTEPVRPDVMPPEPGNGGMGLRKGFIPNAYSCRVEPACTSSHAHAFGRDDKTTSQHPKPLYSTRLLALRAMRHEVEREAAEKLMRIDVEIAKEKGR